MQGDRTLHLGRVRPSGPTASPATLLDAGAAASRTRWRSTSTTAPSTWSRCSPPSRPAWCRSTPTTATPTTSSSTSGTTPTPSPSCSTAASPTPSSASATGCPASALALGRRRQRARCPDWATPYEDAADLGTPGRSRAPWGRSGDDLYMLYTGGTTGMPKGVMWRQDDLIRSIIAVGINPGYAEDAEADYVAHRGRSSPARAWCSVPACPLMHGTGCFTQLIALSRRRLASSLLESRHLDVEELLDTIERAGRQHHRHRGRRLRQADAAGARRQARPLGPLAACSCSPRRA